MDESTEPSAPRPDVLSWWSQAFDEAMLGWTATTATAAARAEAAQADEAREAGGWRPPGGLQVEALSTQVLVSCCQLTDATGVNHCEHPPLSRLPWRRRALWRAAGWWARLRLRVGSWVAGVNFDEERSPW